MEAADEKAAGAPQRRSKQSKAPAEETKKQRVEKPPVLLSRAPVAVAPAKKEVDGYEDDFESYDDDFETDDAPSVKPTKAVPRQEDRRAVPTTNPPEMNQGELDKLRQSIQEENVVAKREAKQSKRDRPKAESSSAKYAHTIACMRQYLTVWCAQRGVCASGG